MVKAQPSLTYLIDSYYRIRQMVPLRSIESASSSRNFQMVREWLTTCVSSHEACRSSLLKSSGSISGAAGENTTLPTRVVDVGSLGEFRPHPRLFETKGISGTYLSLSHRWGSTPKLRTKLSKLGDFQSELPMDLMPPTFRDAMEVTRQLDFRYLWIDSLCIVQDDPDDWRVESQKMGDIFESSSCTIAAMDALDDDKNDRGLFIPRDTDPLAVRLALPYDKVPLTAISQKVFKRKSPVYVWKYQWLKPLSSDRQHQNSDHTVILRPRTVSLYKNAPRSEWYNRGWVLQERILSRRVIYYTKEKLYWSCFTTTRDEEGGDPNSPIRNSLYSARMRSSSQIWPEILSEYVCCSLSHNKDRLVAISGVSRKLESFLSSSIYAGISYDQTGESLLWYTSKTPLQTFDDFHAPSWTWASLNGVVSFSLSPPCATNCCFLIQDITYDTRNECGPGNPNGLCKGTCVSGRVSFTAPAGNLYKSHKLKEIKIEGFQGDPVNDDNIMIRILGSAVKKTGFPMQRIDMDRIMMPMQRKLFIPDHTELLVDECGCIVGFIVPDMNRESDAEIPIVCAGVKLWEQSSTPLGSSPSASDLALDSGNEYWGESSVDIIGLQATEHGHGVYRRVGRGRVICNSWLDRCKKMTIIII